MKEKSPDFINILKKFAPGTSVRTALDDLMRAKIGALIVVDKEGLDLILDGGFRVNSKFTPQRLVELAKMDGAIILSNDMKKILYANTLLAPSIELKSRETGTRHQAAERTSKQLNTIVIAVSERKNKITLFFEDEKYVLEEGSEILRRATETLQILEKQRDLLDNQLSNLNILEISNIITISDVCVVLQRIEMLNRISEVVKGYLVELGKEGTIISMRLKELTMNLNKEREMILKDYFKSKYPKADAILKNMTFDFLLETSNIGRMLFEELNDKPISSKGMRIMSKTNLLEKDITILLTTFKTLDKIFNADKEFLEGIFKNEAFVESLIKDLDNLKEKILVGRRV
ncbi:MAG: DNA integrity scanning diadenylate cyclase DisA [archaeon]